MPNCTKSSLGPTWAEVEAYRDRVREVLPTFRADSVAWEATGHLPREIFSELASRGLFRERWAYGALAGLPLGVALLRELAPISGGLSLAVSLHNEVFIAALDRSSKPEHATLRESALDGKVVGCFAVTEPSGGSDLASISTTATQTADGWRLRGEKRYISNAGSSTHAILLARADGGQSASGLSLFVVAIEPTDIMGYFPKMGTLAADAAQLRFDKDLPPYALIGTPGLGLPLLIRCLSAERLAVSAQLIAAGQHAFRLARAYMRTRRQFMNRLYDMQALRHRLVDCWTALRAAEALFDITLARVMNREVQLYETALLKLHCAGVVGKVLDECLQFLGGRGYSANYPIERMVRDVRLARIGAGTDEVMREVIGSALDMPDAEMESLLRELDAGDVGGIDNALNLG